MKLFLAVVFAVAAYQEPNQFERAVVLGVHDGDTVKLAVEIDLGLHLTTACRLRGINARELKDKPGGQVDRDYLRSLIDLYAIRSGLVAELGGDDKYGRRLVRLWGRDPVTGQMANLNQLMVESGHAVVYMEDGP